MTSQEHEKQDYREACKRCFLYVKKNCHEEIPIEIKDYLKGYRIIVLEEFADTFYEVPTLYVYPLKVF